MRETRTTQASLFDLYATHEYGAQLKALSDLLDEQPTVLELISQELCSADVGRTGACGLSAESVFRCLLLKQILQVSYEQLAFCLSDSPTYRSFARLAAHQMPSRSGLQSTIRRISGGVLQQVHKSVMVGWVDSKAVSLESLRIDSTVVDSNIAPPSDSQLLADGIRVLSRLMANSRHATGVKIRFADQRKRSRSLAFRIFNAKAPEKHALYPKLLRCADVVMSQSQKAIETLQISSGERAKLTKHADQLTHYRHLLTKVIDQTQRRVYAGESVPVADKIVSIFEPHTDILVKGTQQVRFGHKVNLATQADGFITYLNVEQGNPTDAVLYIPVVQACHDDYGQIPDETVADGCYAAQANARAARDGGVKRRVFSKPAGLTLTDMGVKRKTFDRLREFRAGVEGNISEWKRAFGAGKVTWKGEGGFKAYVWSTALSYNLVRMVRFSSG